MNTKKLAVILTIGLTSLFAGCDKSSGGGSTEVVTPSPKEATATVAVPYTVIADLGGFVYGPNGIAEPNPYGTGINVFRNATDWYPAWGYFLEHTSNPPTTMPYVDFNKNMIVAVPQVVSGCSGSERVVEGNSEQITISYKPLPSRDTVGGVPVLCLPYMYLGMRLLSLPASDLPVVLQQ